MYQLIGEDDSVGILRLGEGSVTSIPNNADNAEWRQYQAWLAADPENNIPLPADE
jgi:hypothetical protein